MSISTFSEDIWVSNILPWKNWRSFPKTPQPVLVIATWGKLYVHAWGRFVLRVLLFTTCSRSLPAFYMSFHTSESSFIYKRRFFSRTKYLIHVFDFSPSLLCGYSSQRHKYWHRMLYLFPYNFASYYFKCANSFCM